MDSGFSWALLAELIVIPSKVALPSFSLPLVSSLLSLVSLSSSLDSFVVLSPSVLPDEDDEAEDFHD